MWLHLYAIFILHTVIAVARGLSLAEPETFELEDFDEPDDFSYEALRSIDEAALKVDWYNSFKDLKKAAMAGKQLEVYMRIDQCHRSAEEDQGAPISKAVFVQKFFAWQWMTQYKPLYNGEVIVIPAHQIDRRGIFTNEEFVVMSNGSVLWAVAPVGEAEPVMLTCSLGSSISFRSTDPSRKKMKKASDAIDAVLKGRYTNGVIAVVDYSKCQRIGDAAAPVSVINGGLIDDHLILETRPSGPLQMISTWFYMTKTGRGDIAAAGNDFVLSQDGTTIVDTFTVRDSVNQTVDLRFKCGFNNGVEYYF